MEGLKHPTEPQNTNESMTRCVIEENLNTVATNGPRGLVRSWETQHSSWFVRPQKMLKTGLHSCPCSTEGMLEKKEKPSKGTYQNDSTFFARAMRTRASFPSLSHGSCKALRLP